jgi:2-phosphosulfolactate phosphatase
MKGSVTVDCFPESAHRYGDEYAIVAIDIIRATTTATTAVSLGWDVYPADNVAQAAEISERLSLPLLVGEVGGDMPCGFDITNSPAQIARRQDRHRPMILVSSSGTRLIMEAQERHTVYLACFRNLSAVARHLSGSHEKIAIIGAGSRGQFRREDQMGCAWVADRLIQQGYKPGNGATEEAVARWRGASPMEVRFGKSADYLIRSGQTEDLDFVLRHIDDLETVPVLREGLLVNAARPRTEALATVEAAGVSEHNATEARQ